MNRADLRRIAELRVKDAKALLDSGCYPGAYYIAGYAVECGLKACIAKQTRRYDFPPPRKKVDDCYQHDLQTLLRAAGLELHWKAQLSKDPAFRASWTIVKEWNEAKRYDASISEQDARDLYEAITDRKAGVLPWLKKYW